MAGDALYANVKTLLHCDGANGSTTFTDKSPLAMAVSTTGGAAVSTAESKFGGASLDAVAAGKYITVGGSSDWTFMHLANAVWTWEGFVKSPGSFGADATLFSTSNGASLNAGTYSAVTGATRKVGLQIFRAVSSSFVINGDFPTALPADTNWHHIAITYDHSLASNNAELWVDGVSHGTLSKTANAPTAAAATAPLKISGWSTNGDGKAYFDEIRVTNGVRRYTAGFSAPTVAFADYLADVSGTVTDETGSPAARLVRAYDRRTGALLKEAYTNAADADFGSVKSLLHFEGANGATTTTDAAGPTWTFNGNAQISTATPLTGGASLLLDGTGDFLNATIAGLVGTGDFTVEALIKPASLVNDGEILCISAVGLGTSTFDLVFEVKSTGALRGAIQNGSGGSNADITTATGLIVAGTAYHVAFVADGATARLFIDGVQVQTGAITGTRVQGQTACRIGHLSTDLGGTVTRYFNGRIDEVRATAGVARYTSTFTPPTDRHSDRATGAVGTYTLILTTLEEVTVVALDDATTGTIYNDVCERVIPA